jgi:uncharacterized protein (DUF849 family)
MFLKAAINGGRTRTEAPTVPLTPEEIATDASRAVVLGAAVVHAHARTADGEQSIHPDDIGAMVRAVRTADSSVIIGTTTGLWTCTGHDERMRHVSGWPDGALPDFASIAFSEEGAAEAAELLVSRGIVLESAVWSMADVPSLLASPTLHDNVRILIEPETEDADQAVADCREIAAALRDAGTSCSILYHGHNGTAWPVLRAAVEDGVEARIGLEDVTCDSAGQAADNAAMIVEALSIARDYATR